jgi:hypothetical protein
MFGNHKRWPAAALAGALVALVALAGCSKDPSVASKSAAAFREAQKRGETFEDAAGSHGHGALTPGESQGHSGMAMEGQDKGSMAGMKMGGKGQGGMAGMPGMKMGGKGQGGMAGMPGMKMGGKDQSGMAGMPGMKMGGKDQSGMAGTPGMKMGGKDQSGMAGMPGMKMGGKDQSGMAGMPGMKMGGKNPSAGPPAVAAPVAASPGQPARTLSSDPLDSPAATSVLDARRSAAMAEEMSGGMGDMSGMGGTYRQVDAGRGPEAYEGSEKQTPGAGPHQHGQAIPPSGQEEHSHPPATGAARKEAAVYTCPMHPEVTSTTPGKCPKCGTTLVKRRKG